MTHSYVEQRDGGYWITGTRVSLDSIVYAFLEGLAPESIVDNFSTLTLEEVYGAIAYYLGHRTETDTYLRQAEAEFDEFCRQARAAHPLRRLRDVACPEPVEGLRVSGKAIRDTPK